MFGARGERAILLLDLDYFYCQVRSAHYSSDIRHPH